MEKLPPVEKIYEAWSAVADGRVAIDEAARKATVVSSDRTREYTVSWSDDGSVYNSNDNATYWRGYAGYPVIAVMMMQRRLPLDRLEAERYADVNWKKINTEYHNNYSAALAEIEAVRDIDTRLITEAADRVMAWLSELPETVRRGPLRPPR